MSSAFLSLLVAVDGSETDAVLLDFAARRARGGRLTVVHAVNHATTIATVPGGAFDPAAILDALDEECAATLAAAKAHLTAQGFSDVETAGPEGPAAAAIVGYADAHGIDAIVIGTHGRTGLARLALGSVAQGVLRTAHVPVFALHAPTAPTPPQPAERLGRIFVAIDDSEPSDRALALAIALAKEESAVLHLCHVVDSEEVYLQQRAAHAPEGSAPAPAPVARRLLNAATAQADAQQLSVSCSAPQGKDIAAELLGQAELYKADLIVIGTHGRRGAARLFFGSVATAATIRAVIPVLVVP